jgi:SAC3 family protein LENG8/THP3
LTHSTTISGETTSISKKAKKAQKAVPVVVDFNDQAALSRRAQRFQREHEIERTKTNGALQHHGHLFHHAGTSRSFSPSSFAADDPEVNTVTVYVVSLFVA